MGSSRGSAVSVRMKNNPIQKLITISAMDAKFSPNDASPMDGINMVNVNQICMNSEDIPSHVITPLPFRVRVEISMQLLVVKLGGAASETGKNAVFKLSFGAGRSFFQPGAGLFRKGALLAIRFAPLR